jgi:uncharacterized protein
VSTRPFLVPVGLLRRHPGERRSESRLGPIAEAFITSSRVPQGSSVAVEVVLESVHGGIMARGRVRAPWVGECRRCLGQAKGEVEVEVNELFEPLADPDDTERSYPLDGDQLDLEPMARDAVVLELPLAPLCSPGCRGLCPQCGANRNEGPCRCTGGA